MFGANEITVLKTSNSDINGELSNLKKDLVTPIVFAEKQQKQVDELKAILNAAHNNERKEIKDNEDDDKKYHLLQRYGHILEKIENLLGIISFDFEDLSFAELGNEIEKLITTRNVNERQITYSFYQELFTSTADSLIVIESGFENGELTADQALTQIKSLKMDFKDNLCEVPAQFSESKYETEHLLNMYEEAFSQAKTPAIITIEKPHTINEKTKIQLQTLNNKTKELQLSTESLFKRVSEFEPVVDLADLCTDLRDVDNMFKDDWNLDDAVSKVNNLETKTSHLYNDQLEKNSERKSLSEEIKGLTASTKELDKTTKQEIALRTFDEANTRAQAILNKLPQLKELLEGSSSIPENLASQLGNCYNAVVTQDSDIVSGISAKTEVDPALYDKNLNSLTQDEIYDLQDYIKQLSMERSPKLNKDNPEEEDDDNKDQDGNTNK